MSTQPLPKMLDARKAAVRGTSLGGVLQPQDLQRFRQLLASDAGSVAVEMAFSRDQESRYLLQLHVLADVEVTCQRCLQPMSEQIVSDNRLALVWSDEQAAALPRDLDPVLADEQQCDLWHVVEEELMLALRPFHSHDDDARCQQYLAQFSSGSGRATQDSTLDTARNNRSGTMSASADVGSDSGLQGGPDEGIDGGSDEGLDENLDKRRNPFSVLQQLKPAKNK